MRDLTEHLTEHGAALVGFADLTALPPEARDGLPRAVCFGAALARDVVAGMQAGPTREYAAEYNRTNALLNDLALLAADHLRERGFAAVPLKATDDAAARADMIVPIPHKTVATRAGLGWIGKCALLVTEKFGSAIRINSVLTDAPLATGQPIEASRCGECAACVTACPADAVRGSEWHVGTSREDLVDAHACRLSLVGNMRRPEVQGPVCGMCMSACPWTQTYLRRA
jgi:epoxyqueuosine reductase